MGDSSGDLLIDASTTWRCGHGLRSSALRQLVNPRGKGQIWVLHYKRWYNHYDSTLAQAPTLQDLFDWLERDGKNWNVSGMKVFVPPDQYSSVASFIDLLESEARITERVQRNHWADGLEQAFVKENDALRIKPDANASTSSNGKSSDDIVKKLSLSGIVLEVDGQSGDPDWLKARMIERREQEFTITLQKTRPHILIAAEPWVQHVKEVLKHPDVKAQLRRENLLEEELKRRSMEMKPSPQGDALAWLE